MTGLHTDIVVIGSGISGFAAAMAAAGTKKVLLLERDSSLGGNSTRSNVGTICGAYYRTFSGKPLPAGGPFNQWFVEKLHYEDPAAQPVCHHEGLYIIPYEWSVLQNLIERELHAKGIGVQTDSIASSVVVSGNKITEVTVSRGNNELRIFPEAVIDCSGNGIIAQLAGTKLIKEKSYQAASQLFRIKGLSSLNEFSLNMAIRRAILKADHWPQSYHSLSVVPGSLQANKADLKLTLPEEITDDEEQNRMIREKAHERVKELFCFLCENISAFERVEIDHIFPRLGIRVQQRPEGKTVLTESEVLRCQKSPEGIAVGTWPIEEWDQNGKLHMEYFAPDDGYSIPADCLISGELTNLFFAGKNISATTRAIASARVMGTCLQTGYAAGKIASVSTQEELRNIIKTINDEVSR